MKKLVALSIISLVLTGCVNPGKASVQVDQLQSHRFVLENVDGKTLKSTSAQPEMAFSARQALA
jgi:heat shock protein HslJ